MGKQKENAPPIRQGVVFRVYVDYFMPPFTNSPGVALIISSNVELKLLERTFAELVLGAYDVTYIILPEKDLIINTTKTFLSGETMPI